MQFKQGSTVYSADGHDVGLIDRVVLNPTTKEVTHIVVRKGFLFQEDKLVPLSLIAASTEDRVSLRSGAGDLENLPPFEETHYISAEDADAADAIPMPDLAAPLYWYPPMDGWLGYTESSFGYPPPYPLLYHQT